MTDCCLRGGRGSAKLSYEDGDDHNDLEEVTEVEEVGEFPGQLDTQTT